jgi:hypothetical protein
MNTAHAASNPAKLRFFALHAPKQSDRHPMALSIAEITPFFHSDLMDVPNNPPEQPS